MKNEEQYIHRINTFEDFFFYYNKYPEYRSYEIDVQLTHDGVFVLHHDDLEETSYFKLPNHVPLLEHFLNYTPDNIHLNVEIKDYNLEVITKKEIYRIKELCRGKSCVFSSFNEDICKILGEFKMPYWHLVHNMSDYSKKQKNICVHAEILKEIKIRDHITVRTYDCSLESGKALAKQYKLAGIIFDL